MRKERKYMNGRRLTGVAALALAVWAGLAAGGRNTYAYLTAREAKDNLITLCDNKISLEEEYEPPGTLEPGTSFRKKPILRNLSMVPCLVRAKVSFSSLEAEEFCSLLGQGEGWSLGGDGYFYYADPLAYGECTTPLFSEVQIEAEADPAIVEAALPFDIYVYGESVYDGEDAWEKVKGGEG